MKRLFILFFLFCVTFSGMGQYSKENTPLPDQLSQSQIRHLLLSQEKGTPTWNYAKQSQISRTLGLLSFAIGTAFIVGNAFSMSYNTENLYGDMDKYHYAGIGFGVLNLGVGTWQLIRADRKLEQAKKLYYRE